MNRLLAVVLLCACSSNTGSPDGGRPPDNELASIRADIANACTAGDAGARYSTPADRMLDALAGWSSIRIYAVPAAEIEDARQCTCRLLPTIQPSDLASDVRARAREACCAQADGGLSGWCP